ncbi:hypothetical protein HDU97_004398 [Phlyctochytrium planicorne]|nr:hypothetical protein HDU97_004398 [Phlyctochytrium planicorne]
MDEETIGSFNHLMSLVTGRWVSQSLYTATKLEAFENIPSAPASISAAALAEKLNVHGPFLYRLLRLCAAAGVLQLHTDRTFSLTKKGAILTKDHPMSLRGILLLEESIHHRRMWEHLEHVVRDGPTGATGNMRSHGKEWVDVLFTDPAYNALFNAGMTSFSVMAANFALTAFDWKTIKTVADIGGNEGTLLCKIAKEHPHLSGYVLDIPPVVANSKYPENEGVADRIRLVGGDFFTSDQIEPVDAYILKHVLHDWSDEECVKILKCIHAKAPANAKLLNFDFLVPKPGEPDNGSLGLDVHMMAVVTGRDREEGEVREIFAKSGWKLLRVVPSPTPLALFEAVKV